MKEEMSKRVFADKLGLSIEEKESLFTQIWEIIVGEFAHTGTTEIKSVRYRIDELLHNLKEFDVSKEFIIDSLTKSSKYLQELQDMMWLHFTGEIQESEIAKVDIVNEILKPADDKVKQILPSLHFRSSNHLKQVYNLHPLFLQEPIYIETHKTTANIVLKELLKHTYLYTNDTNPKVCIEIKNKEHEVEVIISSNKLIPKPIMEWFNDKRSSLDLDITGFHKSTLSSLRGVKRWYPKLGWDIQMSNDQKQNMTQMSINMPVKFSSLNK